MPEYRSKETEDDAPKHEGEPQSQGATQQKM
jgi:hypothetical protein